jgi:alkylation response protein AidB-like acyl-CoA dehydrogenase
MHGQDTCELFFDEVRVPAANLLGGAEGRGFAQMMEQLPYERLQIGVGAVASAEQALAITTRYVKERKAFGKPLFDQQNTRFKLAECRAGAHVGRVFLDGCIVRFLAGQLEEASTAIAKLAHRNAVPDHRRVPPAARRLRLHERVPDRAHVGRQPRAAHLCRVERNHEGAGRLVAMNCLHELIQAQARRTPQALSPAG